MSRPDVRADGSHRGLPEAIDPEESVLVPRSALNGTNFSPDPRFHRREGDQLVPACGTRNVTSEGAAVPAWAAAEHGLAPCPTCFPEVEEP